MVFNALYFSPNFSSWCVLKDSSLYRYSSAVDEITEDILLLHGYEVLRCPEIHGKDFAFELLHPVSTNVNVQNNQNGCHLTKCFFFISDTSFFVKISFNESWNFDKSWWWLTPYILIKVALRSCGNFSKF